MSTYSIILSQDKFVHKDSLHFPYEERALQFGDGVYEVIRVYNGEPYLFESHVDRLYRSLAAIKIDLKIEKETLSSLLKELIERNNVEEDCFIYLQVSRGSGTRIHHFPTDMEPNLYAYIQKQPRNIDNVTNGVRTIIVEDIRWKNCYIKSLNLLPNVLAKQAAAEKGCYEAIQHINGVVTECASSNVYLVKNGKVYTHPATNRILNGCVRMAVKEFCEKLDIPFIEEAFTLDDIHEADEMFLTSSNSEVSPIIEVDGKMIQDGKPGPVSTLLQETYEKDANISVKLA
ncbi:D-amino-acid transaminase [Pseudogracilibacillus sp. SO10305]|uniref:D-amino-acid transaminase n=1 Tax=Pseudogracilibacillus sp. SO10305 TaxID=3098292 RepID=UPI00300E45E8